MPANARMIMPSDITADVLAVLRNAKHGKGGRPHYMTAYQVLNELPVQLRDQIISERGMPGAGSGYPYRAAQVVSDAAEVLERQKLVEIEYMDSTRVTFEVQGQAIEAGYEVCGLYRLA